MPYDQNNVFAKILRGEIPCKKVAETKHSLAFQDIRPQTPVHVLVIPKGAYESVDDFSTKATDEEISDFVRLVGKVARDAGVDKSGYRILANHGADANQEVPHFHVHVFGGRRIGRMVERPPQ